MTATLKAIGDWEKGMEIPLATALSASMSVLNRTAEGSCRGLLNMMAQSASKLTRVAPARRQVIENPKFEHVLRKDQYKKARSSGKDMAKYFRYSATRPNGKVLLANKKADISKIGRRGLAKKSWGWRFRAGNRGYPLSSAPAGVLVDSGDFSKVYKLNSRSAAEGGRADQGMTVGFELVNNLKYINEAMPGGWQQQVERSAINRLMGTIRNRLQSQFAQSMRRASNAGRGALLGALR